MSKKVPEPNPQFTSLARVVGEGANLDPRAAYRELVDRARDACARRLEIDPAHVPSILVSTQSLGGVAHVSVTDNGEAFEADAFRELYAVIQNGRLGAVKRKLAASASPADVVGTFGAALLAAFLLADKIVITSRPHGADAEESTKFTCDSRNYTIAPTSSARAGTIVMMRVRPNMQKLGTLEMIREALATHGKTIAYPIRLGSDPVPINR